jgi:hypothetical protein
MPGLFVPTIVRDSLALAALLLVLASPGGARRGGTARGF